LQIATGATQSIAASLPGTVAAIITRNPLFALVPGALQEGGRSFAEDRTPDEQGRVRATIDNAFNNSLTKSTIEGALEFLPIKFVVDNVGKLGFIRFTSRFVMKEEITEIPTTLFQNISDRIFVNPNQPLGEFITDTAWDMVDTAVQTPFAAGGTAGIVHLGVKPFKRFSPEHKEANLNDTLNEAIRKAEEDFGKEFALRSEGQDPDDMSVPRHTDVPDAPLTQEEAQKISTSSSPKVTSSLPTAGLNILSGIIMA